MNDKYLPCKMFDNCLCIKYRDYIEVYDYQNKLLGSIQSNNINEDWELICSGHNPINEKWEDGNGNTCNLEGWK